MENQINSPVKLSLIKYNKLVIVSLIIISLIIINLIISVNISVISLAGNIKLNSKNYLIS